MREWCPVVASDIRKDRFCTKEVGLHENGSKRDVRRVACNPTLVYGKLLNTIKTVFSGVR